MNISAKKRKQVGLYAFIISNPSNKLLIRQLMRISGIVTVIALITFQVLFATSGKGQNMATEKVTVGLQHESLVSAINKIEQQTTLRFYYRKNEVNSVKGLILPQEERSVKETLEQILKNSALSFRQVNNNPYSTKGNTGKF